MCVHIIQIILFYNFNRQKWWYAKDITWWPAYLQSKKKKKKKKKKKDVCANLFFTSWARNRLSYFKKISLIICCFNHSVSEWQHTKLKYICTYQKFYDKWFPTKKFEPSARQWIVGNGYTKLHQRSLLCLIL